MSPSGGISFWSAHGEFKFVIIVLLTSKLSVPTLYLITYDDRYYVWEDAMEDFLRGCGLASHMQLFFAKKTFPDNLSISGENYIKDPS